MNSKTEKICTVLVILYVALFSLVMAKINSKYMYPYGEWDDYSLPAVSILNEGNIGISEGDIAKYKEIFHEFGKYIDDYDRSGFYTKSGEEMAWYFPSYSFVCIPMLLLCVKMGISAEFAFVYTNVILLAAALLVAFFCLKTEMSKRILLVAILSLNPIVFYLGWISGEVFIYSFLVMGLTFWYNKQYRRAAFFTSVAGMLNPTIMSIGIVMIVEFFYEIIKDKSQNDKFSVWIRIYNKKPEIMKFGMCFVIGVVPFIYNFYNTKHINLTAAYSGFTEGNESTIQRVLAYLFDLNYGLLPYYALLMLASIVLLFAAVVRRAWRYLVWIFTFLVNVYLYSIMIHINSGMSGIARYNAWGAVILIFAVVLFFDEILMKQRTRKVTLASLSIGAFLTTLIVLVYGPHYAERTSAYEFTPIAKFVLNTFPQVYEPLPSTFNSRVNRLDGGYAIEKPVIYENKKGEVKKILASAADKQEIMEKYTDMKDSTDEWLSEQFDKMGEGKHYISVWGNHSVKKKPKEYVLGSEISFAGADYLGEDYVINGMYNPEEFFTWTQGKEMEMMFYIPEGKGEKLVFEMDIAGIFSIKQDVEVQVNGENVYSNTLYENDTKIEFEFECPQDGWVDIKFSLPDAVSPNSLGVSIDTRELAVSVRKLVINRK